MASNRGCGTRKAPTGPNDILKRLHASHAGDAFSHRHQAAFHHLHEFSDVSIFTAGLSDCGLPDSHYLNDQGIIGQSLAKEGTYMAVFLSDACRPNSKAPPTPFTCPSPTLFLEAARYAECAP